MWSRIRPRCATLLGKSIVVAYSNSRSPREYEFATDTFSNSRSPREYEFATDTLGFAKISARPRHHAQNALVIEDFKKTSPPRWRRSEPRSRPIPR